LGFDSTKHVVYVNCSIECANYAKDFLGYVPEKNTKGTCPEEIDLSHYFGASYDLKEAQASIEASAKKTLLGSGRGARNRARGIDNANNVGHQQSGSRKIEKLCMVTKKLVGTFDSITAAAESVGTYGSRLSYHMSTNPDEPFESQYWRFAANTERENLSAAGDVGVVRCAQPLASFSSQQSSLSRQHGNASSSTFGDDLTIPSSFFSRKVISSEGNQKRKQQQKVKQSGSDAAHAIEIE